jgi:hypothetical protein
MNRSNVNIYLVQHSNYEGLIERQYCQYPLYSYPDLSVETLIWTVATWPSLQYKILFPWALFIVNIVNIHCICRHFRWNSNMNRSKVAISSVQHSNSEGLIERQYCQHPLYLHPDISAESPIWTVVTWLSLQYSIRFQRALLYVNIVNIHCVWTLTFPLKFQYEP